MAASAWPAVTFSETERDTLADGMLTIKSVSAEQQPNPVPPSASDETRSPTCVDIAEISLRSG